MISDFSPNLDDRDAAQEIARLERWILRACVLEATARKPGNVHPEASFVDLTYDDFLASARAIAPVLARTREWGIGRAVLKAVEQTRSCTPGNSNLGIILLIAPLAAVPPQQSLREGIGSVLAALTRDDARFAYEAIRLANPGGLGSAEKADVASTPQITLLEAMQLATDRDTIAAEYADGFPLVLDFGLERARKWNDFAARWETHLIGLHLELMATRPDTLIARKAGRATAEESARRAREVLDLGGPETEAGQQKLAEFDAWLRADGHRRNPGTTADLIAAILFAAQREGIIVADALP